MKWKLGRPNAKGIWILKTKSGYKSVVINQFDNGQFTGAIGLEKIIASFGPVPEMRDLYPNKPGYEELAKELNEKIIAENARLLE